MIEAIEFCLSSDEYEGYRRRSLVIPYEDRGFGWYRVLILTELDPIKRISNKRRNLVKKFRREGCKIDTAIRHFSKDNNKQKVKLTYNDLIRINIKSSFRYLNDFAFDKLRRIDKNCYED